ncbi:hypothetical protein [Pedobacter antarcticus]|uniref:hypothetical protein n=1 Tax=Pedobacter antarcticus TaxID=34086 RepID=UPI00292F03B0|nr:hypothetical protein [Pedobacter antarcticus]
MSIYILVSNINTREDAKQVEIHLKPYREVLKWTIDLSDDEKVLRVVTAELKCKDVIRLVRDIGFDCRQMEW